MTTSAVATAANTASNYMQSLIQNPNYVGSSSSSSSSSATASSGSTGASSSTFSSNYTTFIKMLTTQLQNQNPLNPTDPNQFTTELIQLSGVEQQMQTNANLSTVASSLSNLGLSNGISYMGKTIQATGSTAPLANSSATWSYDFGQAAQSATLSIADASGKVVWTGAADGSVGNHSFTWNGQDSSGNQLPAGNYTLTVDATDSSGNAVTPTMSMSGVVTGVDNSNGQTQLMLGGVSVPLANVTQVTA